MKKKSLINKSTVKKVKSLPLLNAAVALTAIDGNVNCEMCGSKLSLITSITTLILAFSKRSKMPLNDVLDMVTYQVKQEIAEQDAEAPFGKEFESSGGCRESARRKGNEQSEFDRGYAVGYNEGFIAGLQGSKPNV